MHDLPDVEIADGTEPDAVRREVESRGMTILTINALYPFDVWNAERDPDKPSTSSAMPRRPALGLWCCAR